MQYAFVARYIASGLIGIAGQTLVLYTWVSILGMSKHATLGVVIGFCVALVVTFLLQKYWTFRHQAHRAAHKQFGLYTIVALIGLALNTLLFSLARILFEMMHINFFHWWYLAVYVTIVLFVSMLAFFANYLITFKKVAQ